MGAYIDFIPFLKDIFDSAVSLLNMRVSCFFTHFYEFDKISSFRVTELDFKPLLNQAIGTAPLARYRNS